MKKENIMRIALGTALLFTVNMNADAQFGKLKNLAKKAKEVVKEQVEVPETNVSNTVGTMDNSSDYTSNSSSASASFELSPEMKEINGSKDAGGMDKYIGMTEGDEAIVYSYYQPGTSDFRTDGKYDCGKTYGNMIAQTIVDMYRMIKSDGKRDLASCTPESLRNFYYGKPKGAALVTTAEFPDLLEKAQNHRSKYDSLRKGVIDVLMSKADAEAFKRAAEKAKQAYEAKFGAIPKP